MNIKNDRFKIGNTILSNPIVIASCPATEDKKRILSCAEAGAAAAILKSCHVLGQAPQDKGFRRFCNTERGIWGTSVKSRELMNPDETCALLDGLGKETDMAIIPSIAGIDLEASFWLDTIRYLEPYNPPCIQLDLFYLEEDISLHETQRAIQKLLGQLVKLTEIPIIVKLNYNIRPGTAANMFNNTGISGWSLLDSFRFPLPPSTEIASEGYPHFRYAKGIDSASLFGSWQIPLTMEYLAAMRTQTHLPIVAGGGIQSTSDVLQMLDLGADSIQVATAILREGISWIRKTIAELSRLGYERIPQEKQIPNFISAKASVDKTLCSSCGICADQLMCTAIHMQGNEPVIDPTVCDGCGFCVDLCRKGALALVPTKESKILEDCKGEERCITRR